MLAEGYYYSEAMVKDMNGGYVPARMTYRNGKLRFVYDYNEKTGVYESKDGDFKGKGTADELVKRHPLRAYYYRGVVATDTVMKDRNFVSEEEAQIFVKEEVEKLLTSGEYNFITKVEKQ